MTTIINGSSPSVTFSDGTTQTTAGLPLTGGTVSGNVTVNGNIIQGANTAPAFSVYTSGTGATIGTGATKVTFDTEEYDTNNNFSASRFTPTVAGYYQINAQIQPNASYCGGYIALYKNGTIYKAGTWINTAISFGGFTVSTLVYCNGSTDYLEIYGAFTTSQASAAGAQFTWFNGFLARSA